MIRQSKFFSPHGAVPVGMVASSAIDIGCAEVDTATTWRYCRSVADADGSVAAFGLSRSAARTLMVTSTALGKACMNEASHVVCHCVPSK